MLFFRGVCFGEGCQGGGGLEAQQEKLQKEMR